MWGRTGQKLGERDLCMETISSPNDGSEPSSTKGKCGEDAHLSGEVPRCNKTRSEVAEPLSLNALFIRINPIVWQGCPVKKAMQRNYALEQNMYVGLLV